MGHGVTGRKAPVEGVAVTCNKDCGGSCPLWAFVSRGRVTRITNSPYAGPYMTGCARGFQMPLVVHAPGRLTVPLVRNGPRGSGRFREVGWEEALTLVASRLGEIKARAGVQSILRLGGSGSCRGALHNTGWLTSRFLNLFGGHTEINGNYSTSAANFATPFVLGREPPGIDPGALQWSNLILLWGANLSVNRLGTEMEARVLEARRRGVPVVAVDPRRTLTAKKLATRWIPVFPGTDVALMMGVLYILLQEDMVDRPFAERYSCGFDELERHVRGYDGTPVKTPEWAQEVCGTPAETIVELARLYGKTRPAALIPGPSIQRTLGGEEAIRMTIALQVATGNLGQRGGTSGALTWNRLPMPRMGAISKRPVKGQPVLPVYRWPDAILEGRRGGYPTDIKAIYNVGGNYLVQGSDVLKSQRAFENVEFSVCHDYFLTPTARYCDVVLPVTTFLERQDIVFPDGGHFVLFSNQAVRPVGQSRTDYDVFCDLAERLGFGAEYSEDRDEEAWLRHFVAESEVPDYEEFKSKGIYYGGDQARFAFGQFIEDPEGHPLTTRSRRVEIASALYAQTGFPAIPQQRPVIHESGYPLRMVTPKARFRTHSQNDNIGWFKEREPQVLDMHPTDAAPRAIDDGATVLISSPQGRVQVRVRITEDIVPGVVSLLAGAWPCFSQAGIETSGCANVLTSTEPTQPSQSSRTHSVWVQVEASEDS